MCWSGRSEICVGGVAVRSGQEETSCREPPRRHRIGRSKADAADRFFAHARRWDTSVDVGRGTGGARRRSRRCNAYDGREYVRVQPCATVFDIFRFVVRGARSPKFEDPRGGLIGMCAVHVEVGVGGACRSAVGVWGGVWRRASIFCLLVRELEGRVQQQPAGMQQRDL